MIARKKSSPNNLLRGVISYGIMILWGFGPLAQAEGILVLQTDFGRKDHAVAAMRGIARQVDRNLVIDDLTHDIPAFDIWEAAYRLRAVVDYWPPNTVFVSVVDPGVGSDRESVVARLASGQLVVTPNNGTLTLLGENGELEAVRRIDEKKHRLPGSEGSHTFHGRDLYAHVGAMLASGGLRFEDFEGATEAVTLDYEKAVVESGGAQGGIPVLDVQFGNVWTNVPATARRWKLGRTYEVTVSAPAGEQRFFGEVAFVRTFGDVSRGAPLLYVNSVGNLALALNQANFVERFQIGSGLGWRVTIKTVPGE